MAKINIKDLAQVLVSKYGIATGEAEAFVSQMFETVGDGLQRDRQVKVKGLGTFKLTGVAARRSVNVNTGEPILIEERDKISFTPEAALRDAVNRPFMQFETVVLNDGVDFAPIDRKYSQSETADTPEAPTDGATAAPAAEEAPAAQAAEPVVEETPAAPTAQAAALQAEAPAPEAPQDGPTPAEPAEPQAVQAEQAQPEAAPAPTLLVEPADDEPPAEAETTEEKQPEPAEEEHSEPAKEEPSEQAAPAAAAADSEAAEPNGTEEEEEDNEEEQEEDDAFDRLKHRMKIITVVAAVCLALVVGGIVWLFTQLHLRENRINYLEAKVTQLSSKPQPSKAAPAANLNSAVAEEAEEKTPAAPAKAQGESQSSQKAQPEAAAQKPAAAASQKPSTTPKPATTQKPAAKPQGGTTAAKPQTEQPDYNKDPRIRTGAYAIEGVDHTVKVQAGQTIKSISRAQLGPGMECYIEAVNGGRTEFKAGERINIPKLRLKKRRK